MILGCPYLSSLPALRGKFGSWGSYLDYVERGTILNEDRGRFLTKTTKTGVGSVLSTVLVLVLR